MKISGPSLSGKLSHPHWRGCGEELHEAQTPPSEEEEGVRFLKVPQQLVVLKDHDSTAR